MQHGVCCHRNRDRRSGASHIRTQLSAGSTGNSRTNWTMWSGRFYDGDGSSVLVAILQSVAI